MVIHLIRHARPAFDMRQKVPQGNLAPVIDAHDRCGIIATAPKPPVDGVSQVFTSDIMRARHSAALFFPDCESVSRAVFREAALPPNLPRWLPVRYATGIILARVLWLAGHTQGVESFAQAWHRAALAARILEEAAYCHGDIALVGHGFFNRMIGRRLTQGAWSCRSRQGNGFGSVRSYHKI